MGGLVSNLAIDDADQTGRDLYRKDLSLYSNIESAVH